MGGHVFLPRPGCIMQKANSNYPSCLPLTCVKAREAATQEGVSHQNMPKEAGQTLPPERTIAPHGIALPMPVHLQLGFPSGRQQSG